MRAVVEPLADIEAVEKGTPANSQHVLRHDLDQRHRYIDRRQRNEDPEQLIPESGAVLHLQRVEHIAAEKVQTNAQRHLKEVYADKPREQHRADPALRGPHPTEQRNVDFAHRGRFEIAVGDGQDGADHGDAREAVDQEREDRAAGNHRGGRNIGREILRDPSERIGEEHDHEDHFQAGQNAVEDPQELRHRCG